MGAWRFRCLAFVPLTLHVFEWDAGLACFTAYPWTGKIVVTVLLVWKGLSPQRGVCETVHTMTHFKALPQHVY